MEFAELHYNLDIGAMIVIFYKSNGEKRVMLCTKNTAMASNFNVPENIGYWLHTRNSKFYGTKNIGVIDMEKLDIRAFNSDKILYTEVIGDLREGDTFERAKLRARELRESIKNGNFSVAGNMDSL